MYYDDTPTRVVALDGWEAEWLAGAIRHSMHKSGVFPEARTQLRLERFLEKLGQVMRDDRRTMALRGGTPDEPKLLCGQADDREQSRIDVAIPEDREY